MIVGLMELHLALWDNDSIKAKRSVVKRIAYRCRNTFNVSVSEIEEHDAIDRAVLGVVTVGADHQYIEGLLQKLENFVERLALADLLDAPKHIETY